jgi:hypothetical protein
MNLRNGVLWGLLLPLGCLAAQFEWRTTTPEKAGMDAAKLKTAATEITRRATSALLVVRRGEIVAEWYGPNTSAATLQERLRWPKL